jgi:hypothetical protein
MSRSSAIVLLMTVAAFIPQQVEARYKYGQDCRRGYETCVSKCTGTAAEIDKCKKECSDNEEACAAPKGTIHGAPTANPGTGGTGSGTVHKPPIDSVPTTGTNKGNRRVERRAPRSINERFERQRAPLIGSLGFCDAQIMDLAVFSLGFANLAASAVCTGDY